MNTHLPTIRCHLEDLTKGIENASQKTWMKTAVRSYLINSHENYCPDAVEVVLNNFYKDSLDKHKTTV